MILNAVFLVTCIPVLTAGAAISAGYETIFVLYRQKDPSVVRTYLAAFRSSFRDATLLFLPVALAGVFLAADLLVIYQVIGPAYRFLQYPVWLLVYLLASVAIYAFPLLGHYPARGKQLVKNAVLLSLANVPTTVFILVVHGAILWYALSSPLALAVTVTLGVFFGCGLVMGVCGFFLLRAFERAEIAASDRNGEN